MKSEELRIGNYVYSGIFSNKVIEVYPMFFVQLSKIEDKEHNIKPIPLTEEWLLKFGFKRTNKYDFELIKNDFHFYTSSDFFNGNGFICFNEFDIKIKYIHELQNLYFALTNKELIINN